MPAALTLAGVLLPFAPVLAGAASLSWRDTARLYAPVRTLVVDALRAFELPLWNPYEATGVPLFAQGIHGVLHPLSIAAAWIAPERIDVLLVAYVAAAALGAFVLARALGASRAAATVAGFAFGLSGFVVSMTANLPFLAGAASLPWAVAGLRATGAGTPRGLIAGAAAVAVAALAGDFQSAAIGAVLGIALAWENAGARGALRAAGAVALGAAIAAVQLLPSWAYLSLTPRAAGIDSRDAGEWALAPWRLVELVAPGFFPAPETQWEAPVFQALGGSSYYSAPFVQSVFLGLATAVLAAAGVRARRTGALLAAASGVLLWLAMGDHLGATQASSWIPVWRSFRYAEKLVGPLSLCLAVLAALGADRLRDDAAARRAARAALGAGIAAGVVVLGALVLPTALDRVFAAAGCDAATAELARTNLRRGLVHAALAAVALATVARAVPARLRSAAAAGVVLVAGWAALPFAWHLGDPAAVAVDGPRLTAPMPPTRIATPIARAWCSPDERLGLKDCDARDGLRLAQPSYNVARRIDQIDTYTGLPPRRFELLWARLGDERWRWFRRYGLTHVILVRGGEPPPGAVDAALEATEDAGHRSLAVAVPHRDWASFAARAIPCADTQGAWTAMRALEPEDFGTVAVVHDGPLPASRGVVHATSRRPGAVEVEATSEGDGVLVVADAMSPGWRATIDGVPSPLLEADVLVRAVRWPAGRHLLRMRYAPAEVGLGEDITAAALAVALALAWRGAAGRRDRAGDPPEGPVTGSTPSAATGSGTAG